MICIIFFITSCGIINSGYSYAIVFLLIALIYQMAYKHEVYCNFLFSPAFWFLICASLSYVAIGTRNTVAFYHYGILPAVAYVIGWCASENIQSDKNINFILAIVMGSATHALLNDLLNWGNVSRYTLTDIWTGTVRAATGSGVLNTMTVAIFLYMIVSEKRRAVKAVYFVLFLFTVHYMFVLGTRTQFIIFGMVTAVGGIFVSYRKAGFPGVLKLIVGIFIAVICILLAYKYNLFSLQSWYSNTNLALRFTNEASLGASDDNRVNGLLIGIRELFTYPFGGQIGQAYRHNMWLDVARVSGILPFMLLLAYSMVCIKNAVYLYKNDAMPANLRYLSISIYAGVYINFFIEPIWEGQLDFFLSMCLIDGMINQLERASRNESASRGGIPIASGVHSHM